MKKILLTILPAMGFLASAQTGRVGINTTSPTAKLEVVSKITTNDLRFRNSDATTVPLLVQDNGNIGISNNVTPIAPLDVIALGEGYGICGPSNFAINSSTNHRVVWGANYKNGTSECNHGNTLFAVSQGVNGPGSTLVPSQSIMITNDNTASETNIGGGFYIGPHADTGTQPAAGLYMREDGYNSFSAPAGAAPHNALDINGSLMVGSNGYTDVTSTATAKKCLRGGEMIYLKHFYVCMGNPLQWTQLDN